MKGKIVFLAAMLCTSIPTFTYIHSDDATSKTFFSFLPQYSTGRPEHISAYRRRMMAKEDGLHGSIQAVAFGGRTTSSGDLARYFFPSWKTSLVIAEGPDVNTVDASGFFVGGSDAFKGDAYDLLARNFNIETERHNFKSTIYICPEQTFYGMAFNYKQSFSNSEDSGYWLDVTVPVLHVSNDIKLHEIVKDQSATVTTITDVQDSLVNALNQSDWKYGKFSPSALTKTGVADIEIRFGADSIRTDRYFYGSFVGLIFPTGNKPKAHYIFEPIVGRNHHWGLMWGSSLSFQLAADENYRVQTALDLNSSYFFEGDEVRSFDLKDKQWSRYIPVFTDANATTTSPGINTFTQEMKIRPRGTFQINSALLFTYKTFDCELGLHSYFRQSEEGKLACSWKEGPAIAGVEPATNSTQAESMNLADMKMWNYQIIYQDVDLTNLNIDPTQDTNLYKTLTEEDLNLQSALHPSAIAASIYGAFSYSWKTRNYPSFMCAGGSYQLSADNIAAQRWSVWIKAGVSI